MAAQGCRRPGVEGGVRGRKQAQGPAFKNKRINIQKRNQCAAGSGVG